jgi:hypothetical protein
MGYKPIDTDETYQIDQDGKIIDSILRNVNPERDEKGSFINYKNKKVYVKDLLRQIHGEEAAKAYLKRTEAEAEAIRKARKQAKAKAEEQAETNEKEPEKQADPEQGEGDEKDLSKEEKVAAAADYFKENPEAKYDEVKEALAGAGVKVNDQHVSEGKKAAGLKG